MCAERYGRLLTHMANFAICGRSLCTQSVSMTIEWHHKPSSRIETPVVELNSVSLHPFRIQIFLTDFASTEIFLTDYVFRRKY
jgi:hypothetical protein